MKILLDTDIGSDIDDAVCLAYLLANPACELLGITTVSGEAVHRARLASVLCKHAGKNILIYPGVEEPLSGAQKQPLAPQSVALRNWEHQVEFPQGKAISFLRDTIHQYPGEIILLAIGPMTNIATLFNEDKDIPSLIKGLVLMCGKFQPPHIVEWNAKCDPVAAAIVYNSKIKVHRSIGLDVTTQVTMDAQWVKEKFTTPLLLPVFDFAKVWFEKTKIMTFHDPLAAATIFDSQICRFDKGNVKVELNHDKQNGLTYWTSNGSSGNHEVAVAVDAARFFNHYFSVFK
ncbi:MAG: nucleoside hydrolase [bacterium]